jgi:hypothetical protein
MNRAEGPSLDGADARGPAAKRRYEPPQLTPETRGVSATAKTSHSIIDTHSGVSHSSGPS